MAPQPAYREKEGPVSERGEEGSSSASSPRAWFPSLAIYCRPRLIAVLLMGFSSGLPLALTFATLSFRLAEIGVSRTAIGLFALVGVPYSVKFLWSPLIDRLPIPLWTSHLGRRRGWALAIQPLLALAILGLGIVNPRSAPGLTAVFALAVAFLSASQDIVIDAYRIELLRPEEQGAGAAATQWGYRFGMLAASAGALYAASFGGWRFSYGLMAALMLIGMATVWLTPEPSGAPQLDRLPGQTAAARVAAWLRRAVAAPFSDMLKREGALTILIFVVLYKFGDALAATMSNPLYVSLGFTKVELANIAKVYGFAASLAGLALGGIVVLRLGVMRALLVCGVLQMLSNLMYALQVDSRAQFGGIGANDRRREFDRRDGVGGLCRLPLRPLQRRVHRDPICVVVFVGGGRPHHVVGFGRGARRCARLDSVFRAGHRGLSAGLDPAVVDHAYRKQRSSWAGRRRSAVGQQFGPVTIEPERVTGNFPAPGCRPAAKSAARGSSRPNERPHGPRRSRRPPREQRSAAS